RRTPKRRRCRRGRRRLPAIELRRQQLQDLLGAHAVEVVIEVELLDDCDQAAQVPRAAGGRGAALRAVALRVPIQEVDRLDEAAVGDQVAAESEVVDEGAVLMDGRVEEEARGLPVQGEELVRAGE